MATAVSIPMMASAYGHGIDRANLDSSADPRTDFYDYACGGWIQAHPLTGEYARYGMFDYLRDNARDQLKDLVLNLKDDPQAKVPGSIAQKVSDLYEMGLDTARLNREGAEPIRPLLEKVATISHDNLPEMLGWQAGGIGSTFFSIGVGADVNDANMNIMGIGEIGVGLGDRDYYLEDTEENRKLLDAYHNYLITILTLAGYPESDAKRMADLTLKFEKEVAKNKKTREERRNPALRNNVMSYADFKAKYNNLDWDRFFAAVGIPAPVKLNVSSPRFMEFMNQYIPTLSDQDLRDLMTVETVGGATGLLGEAFTDADFEMFDKLLSGKTEQEPRWKRAMAVPNSMFSEAIGQLYVEKHFPEANKEAMKKLVENLRVALGQHIDNLPWMSDETKRKAHEKLATFTVKIGYPDKWKDYSEITIDPSKSYHENVLAASKWFVMDNLKKDGQPVDKTEWFMSPQTVNAYYNPTTNEICFPAAILQPPYFDPEADDALNYGAIGVVIGHEMTHGFDDSGRQYDKDGNLNDWWVPEDAEKFKVLADGLAAQFDAVEVLPGIFANGRFTLGENIADQGGLRVALTAYLNSLDGKEAPVIDGMTPLQRFYLAYAGLWAGNIRDEEKARLTKVDPHSLGRNRVNVSLRNIAPFFEAFGIQEGDAMFRPEEERVIIW
ncbi:MAG: M13 family metallopeptidase [Bacteroides sp.]|nr:M13 family metallopeptidase [Bacteroides sp.]